MLVFPPSSLKQPLKSPNRLSPPFPVTAVIHPALVTRGWRVREWPSYRCPGQIGRDQHQHVTNVDLPHIQQQRWTTGVVEEWPTSEEARGVATSMQSAMDNRRRYEKVWSQSPGFQITIRDRFGRSNLAMRSGGPLQVTFTWLSLERLLWLWLVSRECYQEGKSIFVLLLCPDQI